MRLSVLLVASAAAVTLMPSLGLADPAQAVVAPQATADADQIVCKMTAPPTGSRLGGGRECHTQRDWDQRQKDAQKSVEDKQKLGLQGGIPSN